MSFVTLTFAPSSDEITSGIPVSVEIEPDVPATIYYTTDGTTPTTDSAVYVGAIEFSSSMMSVVLNAFGVDGGNNVGPVFTQTFAANTQNLSSGRNTMAEGFVLNRANYGPDNVYSYAEDGSTPASFIDFDLEDLHFKKTPNTEIAEGTVVEVGIPNETDTFYVEDERYVQFCTTEKAKYFYPNAKVIVVDNRVDNEIKTVMRPFGSMSDIYSEFGGFRVRGSSDDATYISGGFVKSFYNAEKNLLVSMYYDNNENKWIKNIQQLPAGSRIPATFGMQLGGGMPLVFQWIPRGRPSTI